MYINVFDQFSGRLFNLSQMTHTFKIEVGVLTKKNAFHQKPN